MSDQGPYRRRSARLLLLDRADRVLLLRSWTDPADRGRGHVWMTPGGGVDEFESLPQAAARELREEVGLIVDPRELGEPVAYTAGHADFAWASGTFRDDFFHHRVDAHDVDTSRMETLELTHYAGYRWWTLDELRSTTDVVHPLRLAALLADLLAGRRPDRPVRLPWHH